MTGSVKLHNITATSIGSLRFGPNLLFSESVRKQSGRLPADSMELLCVVVSDCGGWEEGWPQPPRRAHSSWLVV